MGCYNSTVVPASADAVWAQLRNFHNMSWCPNVVSSCELVGYTPGTEEGAKRILNGVFHETLTLLDDEARQMQYSIDDGPETPVAKDKVEGYVGDLRVYPVSDDDSSFVLWTSSWESGGEGAAEFCDPIYRALLADLKAYFAAPEESPFS